METAEQCDFGMPKPDCSVGIKPMTGDKEKIHDPCILRNQKKRKKRSRKQKEKKSERLARVSEFLFLSVSVVRQ